MRRFRPRDPQVTSRIMAAVRSRDTRCELLLRRELWHRGLRYRLHAQRAAGQPLSGKPDLVFAKARVVVFIDGDFWHGRVLLERGPRALRATFRRELQQGWVAKIRGNVERDARYTAELTRCGWKVVRVWESDVKRDVKRIANKLAKVVASPARGSRKRVADHPVANFREC